MKIWINFEEKDIKERKKGWSEGDDSEDQLIFEEEQDLEDCYFEFENWKVILHFKGGYIKMSIIEFGGLFK
jgi:hypothetical protein